MGDWAVLCQPLAGYAVPLAMANHGHQPPFGDNFRTGGKARGNIPSMGTINPIFGLVLPIKGNFLY